MRHGYGVRASAPFGLASHYKPPKQVRASLTSLRSADGGPAVAPTPEPTDRRDRRVDDSRGGFVLKARSDDPPARRKSLTEKSLKKGILSVSDAFRPVVATDVTRLSFPMQGLKIRKQRSTGDLEKRGTGGSIRSNASSASWMSTESSQSQASASVHTDSNASFVIEVGHHVNLAVSARSRAFRSPESRTFEPIIRLTIITIVKMRRACDANRATSIRRTSRWTRR